MKQTVRDEADIFYDLESLCASPGYAHVIAYFCFKDNFILYSEQICVEDVGKLSSFERLIRTEISTLIGLMVKHDINLEIPPPDMFQELIEKTEKILLELHHSIAGPIKFDIKNIDSLRERSHKLASGSVLREPIFYSGESAYSFQYRDLSAKKYLNDDHWFISNKGFRISDACKVLSAISTVQSIQLEALREQMAEMHPDEWTMLPAFYFTVSDIVSHSGLETDIVSAVINSFAAPEGKSNQDFKILNDFNITNAYPILNFGDSRFCLFQHYSLAEALYETPFFWFNDDRKYMNTAMKHRGDFTENFSAERLKLVFGDDNVFANINILDSKKNVVGEIDVLVVFSNRAIILQAKSKKLTIEARKGNDNCIKDDFKKSVQDSYDQALSCSEFLINEDYKLFDSSSNELTVLRQYKEIYIFCVVSDHYPALSFQSRQFLKFKTTEIILSPFVMDVFLLDVMTEMLHTPLHFLSYINRRTGYADRISATHELTILSYHLKQNLWMDGDFDSVYLLDDICADLDLAMMVRRQGMHGSDTPEGILTKHRDTYVGKLLSEIERIEDPLTVDLGFELLRLSGDTVQNLSNTIESFSELARSDGKHHDITVPFGASNSGLTVHFNNYSLTRSKELLQEHCARRKYMLKAGCWFGLCLDPRTLEIRLGVELESTWEPSKDMDNIVRSAPKPKGIIDFRSKSVAKKIGRNDPCPCGSGIKYKKCCLN